MGEATEGPEADYMGIRKLKTSRLALLLAGLACLSFVFGQEPKAPAGESLESLRVRGEKGDAAAQNSLGTVYYEGRGVARDYAEAARWYRKAAEQGHASGQLNLGAL